MKITESRRRKTSINLTSLIDILFLLIIFFTLTTQFTNQKGVAIRLPQAKSAANVTITEKMVVMVDSKNRLYLNGKQFTWDQVQQELESTQYDRAKSVVLNIDESIAHGKVIALLDLLKRNQFKKVVFGTHETP